MPERYEKMRDAIYKKQKTKNLKAAKKKAAMIFNGTRKRGEPPVTRSS